MKLLVKELDDANCKVWDEYVDGHVEATFFHRSAWRLVLQDAFGHRPYYLLAEREGKIVGILPMAQMRSFLFGNSLSSLPFCVYGGIVASDAEAATALRIEATVLAHKLRVDALEFRNSKPSDSGWPSKDLYYSFKKNLSESDDENLKRIPNRQRAMIRKGVKEGLRSEETDDIERIYRVYAESVRNLGTPVFSRKYLEILQRTFVNDCRILMITDDEGEDVAGVLSFYFKGEVLPYYGGSIARARDIKGCNHFMYWELMRRSAAEGLKTFDFGRSKKGTGPFSFKKNWGFEPQALPYEYHLVSAESIPDVNPLNPKYRLMVDTWKRLPLSLANLMGPPIARYLG